MNLLGNRRPRRAVAALATLGAATVALVAATGVAGAQTPTDSASTAPAAGDGWLRFGDFSAAAGPARVSVDGKVLAASATFETVTSYESVTPGRHVLTVTPTGSAPSRPLSITVRVRAGGAATVTALPAGDGSRLTWFRDDLAAAPAGDAKVRVIDTVPEQASLSAEFTAGSTTTTASSSTRSPATPAVSIRQAPYGRASQYTDVKAGTYKVRIAGSGGSTVVTGTHWPVKAGTVASLVVLQPLSGTATLEVLSDAAGAASAPTGGMQTGFGGAAGLLNDHPADHDLLAFEVALAVSLLGGALLVGRRHPKGVRAAALASLVVAGAGCGRSSGSATPATARPKGAPAPAKVATSVPGAARNTVSLAGAGAGAGAGSRVADPTELTIPSIGVHTHVIRLGRKPDGSAQVPKTTTEVGWYTGGPKPGQTGPAAILGHVDSYTGPGVFFRLHQLQAGDSIAVREGTRTVHFVVEQVVTYPKDHFPTAEVFGPVPDRALRLITCGGPFDTSIGHYEDNVVVYATETGRS